MSKNLNELASTMLFTINKSYNLDNQYDDWESELGPTSPSPKLSSYQKKKNNKKKFSQISFFF